jgi:phosphohistidine phosphatase
MKTLLLMRHAKSAWNDPGLADVDRPLAPRGRKAAQQMAAWLKAQGYQPDAALCSSARRAQETLDVLKPVLPDSVCIQSLRELYMAMPREMLELVAKAPENASCLLLVGHNPGVGDMASWLAGTGDPKTIAKMRGKFPTAAIAVLRFDLDRWSELGGEAAELVDFARPRDQGRKLT